MAYIPSECTLKQYEDVIYSGDAKHKLYIKHGDTIIGKDGDNNASPFASSFKWKRRLLSNGNNYFSLDNFVSQEIELTLNDYTISNLDEDVEIKIGTYIDDIDDYVYVPLGIFKIQTTSTDDKGKTTYTLRDKSVDFDFYYNAKPLIDDSEHVDEQGNKYVTKQEILLDICDKANIDYVGDLDFLGYNDALAIYDNTISGRIYIAYIFEQAGRIAYMTRDGKLNSILLDNMQEKEIPANVVESFSVAETYKISKVKYQADEIVFESGNDDFDTLYINTQNPYITSQSQIDSIYNLVNNFEIMSFDTGIVMGNPLFDPWDILVLNYNEETYKTLAQYELQYKGSITSNYDTIIDYVTKNTNFSNFGSDETFKKSITQTINNINASISTVISQVSGLDEKTTEIDKNLDGIETRVTQTEGSLNETTGKIDTLTSKTTSLEQTSGAITASVSTIEGKVDNLSGEIDKANDSYKEITRFVSLDDEGVHVGLKGSNMEILITENEIDFKTGTSKSAYINNNELYISDNTVLNKQTIGKWETKPDANNNLNTRWIG